MYIGIHIYMSICIYSSLHTMLHRSHQSYQLWLGMRPPHKCLIDSISCKRLHLEWRQFDLVNDRRQCSVADSANVQHPVMVHCALTLTSPHTNGCASARSALPESMGAHFVGE